MDILPWFLVGACVAALAVMAYLLRSRTPPKRLDVSAQDLLHDLTHRGSAILRVEVVDAAHLMLRSPRG